jgi:hypothetical protein
MKGLLTLAVALLATLVAAAPAAATRYVAGSEGSGDPFFPLAGNGGYDVRHYSLGLSYDPAPANQLEGVCGDPREGHTEPVPLQPGPA